MIILAASDTIAGVASQASKVTCTLMGMELNGTTESYKVLDQRQLSNSAATIYTATGVQAFIRSVQVVNTDLAAAMTFQLFRGGTAAVNAITPVYTLPAGGSATYEDGFGWSINTVQPGTTIHEPILDSFMEINSIAVPAAPTTDKLRVFARKMSGRMLPKWIGPSGIDTFFQPALFANNTAMYSPSGGTTVTGGWGTTWAKGGSAGTVNHPTPSNASPAMVNQMKRTRHVNAVTTTNQAMGIISSASGMPWVWRGDAAGLGGFFFFARFIIELWPADSVRLFVGLVAGATEMVISDTALANCIGLWHDTTEGANVLSLLTKDASTPTKTAINGATLAAGQAFDFFMFCKPNDSTAYYRLDSINAGTTLVDSSISTTLPVASAFLGPQVEISNGTANITATTVGIGVNRIYIESDH